LKESFARGFENWAQLDLPVFLDALLPKPDACMLMSFHAAQNPAHRHRRVVLGPTSHVVQQPPPENEGEHPFCPCCMFTHCFDSFDKLLAADQFYGVRLFVMRNDQNAMEADCRVNGEDWPAGKEALLKYGQNWPHRGFEYRKQYLAIQRSPA
jgi:hypothetical protein